MNNWLIILSSLLYLALLFSVAYYAEWRSAIGKSLINNPYVYALSLAVYCTAWTFFGSVGRATTHGIEFLYIYIGPTIMAPLFWLVFRKLIRIVKMQRINSIADFISTRYGKNITLGMIVTLLCIIGIIPYIAIQIKAISSGLDILLDTVPQQGLPLWKDSTVYIALVLAVFVILFGTRSVDASEKHEGMVAAIAFESIIKIIAFTAVGLFVTYTLFNGFGDIFSKAAVHPKLNKLFTIQSGNTYVQLFMVMLLSMLAIFLLPRQFQVAVLENTKEQHLKKAMWLFPLYLLLINVFVLPVAFGGTLLLDGQSFHPDTYVLAIPKEAGKDWLTMLVFIGGFSAASSMVIVETIALSTMVSNNILLPGLFSIDAFKEGLDQSIRKFILYTRRISILLIIALALVYDKLIAGSFSLVSVGLVSFAAVAQFAPAVIGGIYWKQANKTAAITGMLIGFAVWFYTMVIPSMAGAGLLQPGLMEEGLFGWSFLKPQALFGLEGWDTISHGTFWSLFFNTGFFIGLSLFTQPRPQEVYAAETFVDVYKYALPLDETQQFWKGSAEIKDLRNLLNNFIGTERTEQILQSYASKHRMLLTGKADAHLVGFCEKILAGAIGSASARIMIRSVVKEADLSVDEVMKILRETQVMKESNKELKKQQEALRKVTDELQQANEQMKQMDAIKDEFLYTVTHELRTPLTSIRALSEILYDNPDLPLADQQQYLEAVVKETVRLSHLITQVLNLERYESGRARLNIAELSVETMLQDAIAGIEPIAQEKQIQIQTKLAPLVLLQGDRDLLAQVFTNLLSNAVKFAKTHIQVMAKQEADWLHIVVTDDGAGIDPEVHELIFDKFFQAKNQTLKKPEGSGLGLAISRRITEMHRGKIWVDSEPGKGASFHVQLPVLLND